MFATFDQGVMMDIAREAMPSVPVEDGVWLREYDNYYRSRTASRPLPVLRVRYADPQRTWLYLDPQHGTIAQSFDRSSRLRRWLYNGRHTFDLPVIRDYRLVSDVAMILLSIGGFASSVTTLWPSWSRLRRNAKRLVAGAIGPRRSPRRVQRRAWPGPVSPPRSRPLIPGHPTHGRMPGCRAGRSPGERAPAGRLARPDSGF